MTPNFEQQLAEIVSEYDAALARSVHADASDVLSRTMVTDMRTRCTAAIARASGPTSLYYMSVLEFKKLKHHPWDHLANEMGVARALLSDIRKGYLKSLEELLHGDAFGDFLEMAAHLADTGYKDAAAVLVGSTLEVHIRNLCKKHNISTSQGGKEKKANELNSELTKEGVYPKLDQKNVTAWLDLRNKAAHGRYSEYTKHQVDLFLQNVRDFIVRHPA